MYSDHYQAETTGVVVGRRQGRQAGYTEGWNAAVAACQAKITELQTTLNAMFVIAYPALATIHHSDDRNIQDFFVKHYEASVQQNATRLRHVPHQDPSVLSYEQAIQTVINRWIATAHANDNPPSP